MPTKPGATDAEVRVGWRMAGLGMQVASEVAAGALVGWLIDRWRGGGTTATLIGGIAGISVGLWTLLRGALALNRDLDRVSPTKGRGTPLIDPQPDKEPASDGIDEADDTWTRWDDDTRPEESDDDDDAEHHHRSH
jgi:hypothetical protein